MRWLLFIAAVSLTSCDYRLEPIPSDAEVVQVEHAIATDACIGGAERWERRYKYHLDPTALQSSCLGWTEM